VDLTSLIGGVATVASVTSFFPQAWKVLKTRDTSAISAKMYAITVTGFTLWFIYGLRLASWPLIAANGLCLLLSAFILIMKLLPQEKKEAVASALRPD
jgi:MtN3 and saliva related transmembrane protein